MQTAQESLQTAKNHYEAGAYDEALGSLSLGFRADVEYKPLYGLASDILEKLGAAEEKALFEDALTRFDAFEPFNNLGVHFFQLGHDDLALPFLQKAVGIDASDSETLYGLAMILARRSQIGSAIEVLEKDTQKVFWNYLFWAKLRVMHDLPEGVQTALDELYAVLDQEPDQLEVAIPRQKVNEVKEMLVRYGQIEIPRQHIQDWHFIQYGGAILDFFEDDVAGGRYVATWGSNAALRTVLQKLTRYLAIMDVTIDHVRYMDNRNAEIIARVLADMLGIDHGVYGAAEECARCLIVGGDTSDFNASEELARLEKETIVFALNHNWREPSYITPDIIGLMSQMYSFPWEGGAMRIVDAEKGQTETSEPDARDADVIAAEILAIEPEAFDESIFDVYTRHQRQLKGIGDLAGEHRYNFMVESPVPGAYFGGNLEEN